MTCKLGITGCIGSGKSLVGQLLTECGVPVLDTDAVVHALYTQPDKQAAVAALFPDETLLVSGPNGSELNRERLGQLVFADAPTSDENKARLEALVHPWVREATEAFLRQAEADAVPLVAVLVPLLFEGGSEGFYDQIWTVVVEPESLLITRLQQRHPQWTKAQCYERLAKQWPQSEKARRATALIDNSGTPDVTRQRVQAQLATLTGGAVC